MLLPLEHGVDVQLELEYRCSNEGPRGFIVHHLESSEMLLHGVIQMPQFLAITILECRGFEDHANMSLMDETLDDRNEIVDIQWLRCSIHRSKTGLQ